MLSTVRRISEKAVSLHLEPDALICHVQTGGVYQVMGPIRVKINGRWYECVRYAPTDGREEEFARESGEFEGRFEQYDDKL